MMIMTGDRKQLSSSTVFTHTYFSSILFSLHPDIQMLLGVAFKAQYFIQNAAGYL